MSSHCVFCKIIKGHIKPHKVFEDEQTLAFLDANPLVKGHTLAIPKIHVSRLETLDWNTAKAFFRTIHRMIPPIQKAMSAQATTVAINNGKESGQEIPHVHAHIVPRFRGNKGGSIHSIMKRRPRISQVEMQKIAEKIRGLPS